MGDWLSGWYGSDTFGGGCDLEPGRVVVHEYKGTGSGQTTTSPSDSFKSKVVAGNGRCVEVLSARIGGRSSSSAPQHLGFRGKLDSECQTPVWRLLLVTTSQYLRTASKLLPKTDSETRTGSKDQDSGNLYCQRGPRESHAVTLGTTDVRGFGQRMTCSPIRRLIPMSPF